MLLKDKVAVSLAGHSLAQVEAVVEDIVAAGGSALESNP
jgi:orotate phosphoribosyltransferase